MDIENLCMAGRQCLTAFNNEAYTAGLYLSHLWQYTPFVLNTKAQTPLVQSAVDFCISDHNSYYCKHFTAPWTLSRTTRVSWYQKCTTKVKQSMNNENWCKIDKLSQQEVLQMQRTAGLILSLAKIKVIFKLTQGHWYSCHSIGHT